MVRADPPRSGPPSSLNPKYLQAFLHSLGHKPPLRTGTQFAQERPLGFSESRRGGAYAKDCAPIMMLSYRRLAVGGGRPRPSQRLLVPLLMNSEGG